VQCKLCKQSVNNVIYHVRQTADSRTTDVRTAMHRYLFNSSQCHPSPSHPSASICLALDALRQSSENAIVIRQLRQLPDASGKLKLICFAEHAPCSWQKAVVPALRRVSPARYQKPISLVRSCAVTDQRNLAYKPRKANGRRRAYTIQQPSRVL